MKRHTPTTFSTVTILILFARINHVILQEESIQVNFFAFYEDNSTKNLMDLAVDYLKENPELGVTIGSIYPIMVTSTSSDATKLIDSTCQSVEDAYKQPSQQRPDFALDFTRAGIPSESIKVITRFMKIPTISGTFGQDGDVREWRYLTSAEKGYLIQVSPPSDVLPQAIRSIVDLQNITEVAILYDDEVYEMKHKFQSLLQNMPTVHSFFKLETNPYEIRNQLDSILAMNFRTLFFVIKPPNISYAWTEIEKRLLNQLVDRRAYRLPTINKADIVLYSMSLVSGTPDVPAHSREYGDLLKLVHMSPQDNQYGDSAEAKRRLGFYDRKRSSDDILTDCFYFDLAVDALIAIAKVKSKLGAKLNLPVPVSCQNVSTSDIELDVDLYPEFKEAAKGNLIKFVVNGNGYNYPEFKMDLNRVDPPKIMNDSTITFMGEWVSRFMEKDAISIGNRSSQFWFDHLTREQKSRMQQTMKLEECRHNLGQESSNTNSCELKDEEKTHADEFYHFGQIVASRLRDLNKTNEEIPRDAEFRILRIFQNESRYETD